MFRTSFSVCVVVVVYLFNSAFANSTVCYACNGASCNDPFNKDKASLMYCSNDRKLTNMNSQRIVSGDTSASGDLKDWGSLEDKIWGFFFGTNNEFVCVTSAYYNNVHLTNMTIRRCMPKSYKNMAPCTYLSSTINSGYGTMLKCSSCDTDLCNSGVDLRHCILTILVVSCLKLLF